MSWILIYEVDKRILISSILAMASKAGVMVALW